MTDPEVRVVGPGDGAILDRVVEGVFDHPVSARWWGEFLDDPRHHLAVALDGGWVVGMASGVHYVHPDKPPELWINEVGVAPPHRRRGVARRLVTALLQRGRALGCGDAWVLTEGDNAAARGLYASLGGVEEERPVYVTFTLAAASADD